ncbi:MAG: secretin N-terminal domain-containing protein [Planctomycetota bacterium]|jgi:type IV pilus assembly protein PilQ
MANGMAIITTPHVPWRRLRVAAKFNAFLACVVILASPDIPMVHGQSSTNPEEQAGMVDIENTMKSVGENPTKQNGIKVGPGDLVELHVQGLPLADALQMLSLEGERNIVASPNVTGTVTANLYRVPFEKALEAILAPNGAGYRIDSNFVYVYTVEELEKFDEAMSQGYRSEVFPLSYVSAADASAFITPILDEGESVTASADTESGLENEPTEGGGASNASQDVVMVNALPGKLKEVAELIKKIDVRPRQVLIEATILRAQIADENALGVDFTIVSGVDLELLGATSNGIQDLMLGQLPTERYEKFNSNISTDFRDQVPSGGLTLGIIKDNVALFVRALEQITDTTVLANPKILALNKQKGQVIVGRRDGYLTTTVTETQTVQTVEFLVTGTQLIFRPYIGDDDYVRMELHPEDSVGFVSAQGLPSEQTTEVTTNVIVKDGQTILIGGLFREVTSSTHQQVPGVGNIPLLGSVFKAQNDNTDREEVIILLTVKIIKDQDMYADESLEVLDNMDKMRIGARRGLMWHGRGRLAQGAYQKALAALNEGDTKKALWYADVATTIQPRFISAINFKERILGQRLVDIEGSAAREFIFEVIAREKGYPTQMFGRDMTNGPTELPREAPGNK